MKNRLLIFGLLLVPVLQLQAAISETLPDFQPRALLYGTITDKTTRKPIPDANVVLKGTRFGAASGDGGYYVISGLDPGTYSVAVQVIGYRTETREGILIDSKTVLDIEMTPAVVVLPSVLVTATRSQHLENGITLPSEVLTEVQFKERNAKTAAEVLETAEGLMVKDYGGFAGLKSLSIRGSEDSQVLILLDGQRLNLAQGGGVDLNAFPIEAFERIEVVRGGHSAVMGSDALGGTVHLITRETLPARGFSTSLRSFFGSFGTQGLDATLSHSIAGVSIFASLHRTTSQGDFSYHIADSSAVRANNDFTGDAFFVKARIPTGRSGRIGLLFQTLRTKRGVCGSLDWLTPQARRDDRRNWFGIQVLQQPTRRTQLTLNLYGQDSRQTYRDQGAWIPEESRHQNRTLGADLQARWISSSVWTPSAGIEYTNDRVQSTDIGEISRSRTGFFVHSEIHKPFDLFGRTARFRATQAARWDKYSDVPTPICPSAGLSLEIGRTTPVTFRWNVAKSYRVPSLNDLHWPQDAYTRGNPDLRPEDGTSVDFGIQYMNLQNLGLTLECTAYSNQIRDLILWEAGDDWIWTPCNVGRARIVGLENRIGFRTRDNRLHVQVLYTRTRAKDRTPDAVTEGKTLIYRPDDNFGVLAGCSMGPIRINVDARIVGKRYSSADNTGSLPAYGTLGANAAMSFRWKVLTAVVRAEVRNALDSQIRVIEGYPIPGREFRLSFDVTY